MNYKTVWLVWALKPGEARLAAVTTTETWADHYMVNLPNLYPGFRMAKEEAPLDHAFGADDGFQALVLGKVGRHAF